MSQAKSQTKHPYPDQKLRVLHLSGSDREIGRAHAEAMGDSVRHGMAAFYYEFWQRMVGSVKRPGLEGWFVRLGQRLVDPYFIKRLARNIPQEAMDRLQGIVDVSGMPMQQLLTLVVLPDLLPWLQAMSTRFQPDAFVGVNPPTFGCSSFVHSGQNFLHGRNLDFPGVAYWDRYPLIQCTRRTGKIPFIGFSTAGVPICGITGINEAQISVSLHQHYCRSTYVKGTLPFVIGEEILAGATTLSEAKEILSQFRVATSWAFVVTDGKTRDAFICETHPDAVGFRELSNEAGCLSHSNYFQTPECQPMEYAATARMNWDNFARKTRLENLVKGEGHHLTPQKAVQFMGDHFDPYWGREKPFNRTISQVFNIQSLVLDPEKMKVWIAEGTAPVQLREYFEYDLAEIFAGHDGKTGISYPGFQFHSESTHASKEAYILSFIAAMDGNLDTAWEEMERSLEAEFFPEVALTGAVVQMKRHNYEKAVGLLERAYAVLEEQVVARNVVPPEYFEIQFFLARAYDLVGRRQEAVATYRRIYGDVRLEDPNVRKMAMKEGPYTPDKLERILMPYSTYIPFQ